VSETRATILETARRLFHEQGYEATGIAQILKAADVNSGSLYHFFASKEALLIGVLEYYVQLLMPVIMNPVEEATTDPVERVFTLLANYRRGLESTGCKMGCPIGNLALEVGDASPEVRRLIDLNFNNWIANVEKWLIAAGDRLPADADRRELAKLVLTVMEGAIMQGRAAANIAAFDASITQLRMYFDLLEERACGAPAR
jgi:TetR/AcrR family transcriptional repressor of nem operon